MTGKRCQVCDGPIVDGRCKLCGMPYRNDEILYHLNENRSEHYRHATPKAREIMKEQEIPQGDRKVSGKKHSEKGAQNTYQKQVHREIKKKGGKTAGRLSVFLIVAVILLGIIPSVVTVVKEAYEEKWLYSSSTEDHDVYFSMPGNDDVYFLAEEDEPGSMLYTMVYGYDSVEVGMDMKPGTYHVYVEDGSATVQVCKADKTKNYSVEEDKREKVLVLKAGDTVFVYDADAANRKVYFRLLNKSEE